MAKSFDIECYLIRTGSTQWEEAGRVCGQCELPLGQAGRSAVMAELASLRGAAFGWVFCGPDEASLATAKMVAEAGGGRVKPVEGLEEMSLGLWEGLRECELDEKFPTVYRQWIEDPASVMVPEGETAAEAQERAVEALAGALGKVKPGERVAIVMRPIVLGLVKCWLSGVPMSQLWSVAEDRPATERFTVSRDLLSPAHRALGTGR